MLSDLVEMSFPPQNQYGWKHACIWQHQRLCYRECVKRRIIAGAATTAPAPAPAAVIVIIIVIACC